ncbi:MAG: OsmC family protein [Planctomycetota bacterium]
MCGTLAGALEARKISTVDKLVAHTEGDIEEVDGVIQIVRIRVRFEVPVPEDRREAADRAVATFADKCPAYASIKGAMDFEFSGTWTDE